MYMYIYKYIYIHIYIYIHNLSFPFASHLRTYVWGQLSSASLQYTLNLFGGRIQMSWYTASWCTQNFPLSTFVCSTVRFSSAATSTCPSTAKRSPTIPVSALPCLQSSTFCQKELELRFLPTWAVLRCVQMCKCTETSVLRVGACAVGDVAVA